MPSAGLRSRLIGTLEGSYGNYWSSTVDGIHSRQLFFFNNAYMPTIERANGLSVRCIKHTEINGDEPSAAFSGTPTSGEVPLTVSFTDESTGDPESWSWDFGDGNTSTAQNPEHTYQEEGSYTVELTVENSFGSDTEIKTEYITVSDSGNGDDTEVVDVLNPATGQTWMDRNLGAISTGSWAYGDHYQWGRAADGHQKINSATTSTLSTSDTPGHGDFILSTFEAHWDWRSRKTITCGRG